MKIIVTGGSGFLGRYIVNSLLKEGHEVAVFGRSFPKDLAEKGVKCLRGCLSHPVQVNNALFNVEAVFHVGAKAGIWGKWKDFYNTNVLGTYNVLKACQQHSIPYLVYTSTPSVVFSGKDIIKKDETMSYGRNFLCHYARSKAMAEKMVLKANTSAFKTIALRPHLIWGVGDNHLIPKILQRAQKGRLVQIGEGENLVDLTHVKNAAYGHLLAFKALQKKDFLGGKAYFLSDDAPVNLWQWLNDLLEKFNLAKIKNKISFKKAYLGGGFLELIYNTFRLKSDPLLTRFLAVQLSKNHYFDLSSAKKDFSYAPIISNEQGIKELILGHKAHRIGGSQDS